MADISVRFVGIADERVITAADLKSAGVNYGGPDLVWNAKNLFRVDVPESASMLEVLRAQGHFRIEDTKGSGAVETLLDATDPTTEGDVIVDAQTGAKIATKPNKA